MTATANQTTRFGIWHHLSNGHVRDTFGGYCHAASEVDALAEARRRFPTAIEVSVAVRPECPAAQAFWQDVVGSLTTEIDSVLEAGRMSA